MGSLEGLGQIQPEALAELAVPESNELDQAQWIGLGITSAVAVVAGAVTAWAVGGKPMSGALVGLGGSMVAFAVFPPVWLTVERARCAAPREAPATPSPSTTERLRDAARAARELLGDAAPAAGELAPGAEAAVVRGFTRPSKAHRTIGGVAGASLVGLGLILRGAA